MHRCLVVANQTLGGEGLAEVIGERIAAGPCRFHILVPATVPHEHTTWTEGEAVSLARERLEKALARFAELGAEASGEVGDADPLLAMRDALGDEEYDEIVLSTLPPGISRWLRLDLPRRTEKTFGVPVTHVQGSEGS